ncbi:hypothetical protein Ccrd_026166, partial [Cynara cardunculus var. scolymus]
RQVTGVLEGTYVTQSSRGTTSVKVLRLQEWLPGENVSLFVASIPIICTRLKNVIVIGFNSSIVVSWNACQSHNKRRISCGNQHGINLMMCTAWRT